MSVDTPGDVRPSPPLLGVRVRRTTPTEQRQTSQTPTEVDATPSATATTEPTATQTPDPVEKRTWPDSHYGGPLVSAHEHINGPDGFQMNHETMGWYVRWMRHNGVAQAMAITSEQYIPPVREHDDRLVPFYFPWHETHQHFDTLRTALEQRLDSYPFFVGLGEFTLYDNPADDRPAISSEPSPVARRLRPCRHT